MPVKAKRFKSYTLLSLQVFCHHQSVGPVKILLFLKGTMPDADYKMQIVQLWGDGRARAPSPSGKLLRLQELPGLGGPKFELGDGGVTVGFVAEEEHGKGRVFIDIDADGTVGEDDGAGGELMPAAAGDLANKEGGLAEGAGGVEGERAGGHG